MSPLLDRLASTSWLWRPAPKKRIRRAHWGPEMLEIRAVPAVNLAGAWEFQGQATSITQNGTTLTFTNEHGGVSTGTFINNETQVIAHDWGNLVGTLVGTTRIEWANQSVWTRTLPDISGAYTFNGRPTSVAQSGTTLTFTNENGQQSSGFFINNNTQVQAVEWNIVGTLVDDDIHWSNGSVWFKSGTVINPPDISGAWSINGQATSIVQSGVNLTFTNERGETANGVFISDTQVRADGWGGLIGTLSADTNTLNWANGSVWVRDVDVGDVPDLAGTWLFNQQEARIDQNGTSLTFTNEFGNVTSGSFISPTEVRANLWGITGLISADANTITWSNGSVWVRGSATFPNIAGTYDVENDGSSLTASIQQTGGSLRFVNERGEASTGFFNDADTVTASNWFNLQGQLVGNQIRWGNGTVWTKIS